MTATPSLGSLKVDPYAGISYASLKKDRIAAQAARRIDIVVCVHDALDCVAPCLASIRASMAAHHRLIVIDDGSDAATRSCLEATAAAEPRMALHRNGVALGYTKACNIGLKMATGEFIVLLNSDTIVSGDWLLKLADAVFSVPGAGIVGPLSNAASHQSIPDHLVTSDNTATNPLPPDINAAHMDRHCESWTLGPILPRVPLVHGFCLGIRREVIDAIGTMDEELFPRGYGEENDYCFRAADAGFALVIATHCFVYHAKSRSYAASDRQALQRQAGETLIKKYGPDRVARAVATASDNPLLQHMRDQARSLNEHPAVTSTG
jgi:GT2 family glycosyltransferase